MMGRIPRIKFLGKRFIIKNSKHNLSTDIHSLDLNNKTIPTIMNHHSNIHSNNIINSNYEDIQLSNMRKIISKRLSESKSNVPHHYTSIDCEIDNIMKIRSKFKFKYQIQISLNDFILKSVSYALKKFPTLNTNQSNIDISVAVATPSGLITPIVKNVGRKSLQEINNDFKNLVEKARNNKLKPHEFQGGTFTISNLGGFGIKQFTAVINPPQTCILAIGNGRKEFVVPNEIEKDDSSKDLRIATLMNVTLSSDRRVVDPETSAEFLTLFKKYIENPDLLML